MSTRAAVPLAALIVVSSCGGRPIGVSPDSGPEGQPADVAQVPPIRDVSRGRIVREAPADVAPQDWILYKCPACTDTAPGAVRAVRCDGSDEISFGSPPDGAEVAGGRLIQGALVVTVQGQDGWAVWKKAGAAWSEVRLDADGKTRLVASPHLEGQFTADGADGTRFIYSRSYTGRVQDAVSFFDVVSQKGADFVGQAVPGAVDLQLQFASLAAHRLAYFFYSPSGMSPGQRSRLDVYDEKTGKVTFFPLARPGAIAGTLDGNIAVLAGGDLRVLDTSGAARWDLHMPLPIDGLTSVDSGGLGFSSGGDVYCTIGAFEVLQVTSSPAAEALLR
jgi:hypothetical protein